jgi:hypothetical protein
LPRAGLNPPGGSANFRRATFNLLPITSTNREQARVSAPDRCGAETQVKIPGLDGFWRGTMGACARAGKTSREAEWVETNGKRQAKLTERSYLPIKTATKKVAVSGRLMRCARLQRIASGQCVAKPPRCVCAMQSIFLGFVPPNGPHSLSSMLRFPRVLNNE